MSFRETNAFVTGIYVRQQAYQLFETIKKIMYNTLKIQILFETIKKTMYNTLKIKKYKGCKNKS